MSFRSTLLKADAVIALAFACFTPASAAPEGKIQINYHRVDGNYEKWGVHLWKSPNMPLEGVEWPNPMMPTGTNDFGVYWVRDKAEFNTSGGAKCKVNYIIHKGDIKEQGGKDMFFDGKTYSEIWVWEKDSTIYYSLEEVMKAHPEFQPKK